MSVTNTFEVFEGRLGGGKTYNATVRIIDRIRRGGIVATNIQLNKHAIEELCESRWKVRVEIDKQLFIISEDQLQDFHRYIPLGDGIGLNPLLVFDEFHLWFNSRDFAKSHEKHRPTLTFITQARKLHVDLLLISQSMLNIDKQFVRQIHFVWRFRDMEKFLVSGLGKIPFLSNYIFCIQCDQDARTVLQTRMIKKDKQVFACYETTALLRPIQDLSGNVVKNIELKSTKESLKLNPKNHYLWAAMFGLATAVKLYFS